MGEFLDEYGDLIVESISGVILLTILALIISTGSSVLNTDVFDEGSYNINMQSKIDAKTPGIPDIQVRNQIILETDESLDLSECIISAYGSRYCNFNILSREESRSTWTIKRNLKAGYVNVVGLYNVRRQVGSYELRFYVKGTGRYGEKTYKTCTVTYIEDWEDD